MKVKRLEQSDQNNQFVNASPKESSPNNGKRLVWIIWFPNMTPVFVSICLEKNYLQIKLPAEKLFFNDINLTCWKV